MYMLMGKSAAHWTSLNWTPMGSKICPDYCGVHVSRFELYTGVHPALSICYEVVTTHISEVRISEVHCVFL